MEVKPMYNMVAKQWKEITVEDLKAPSNNALATGPFGSSIGSRFFQDHGFPVIRGSNLSNDALIRFNDHGLVFISEEKAAEFKRSIVRKGDLIFTCWGTINQVGLIDDTAKHLEYVISNKQMKFTPNPNKADSLFLYYLFSSSEVQNKLRNQSIGSSVPGFNLGQLRAMCLKVPPLPEQRAIASTLRDVDVLLVALDHLIAKKRDIKQAAMQELLTGKRRLPGFACSKGYKQTEVGLIPENWEIRSASSILNKGRLGGNYPNQDKETNYPLIKMGNIGRGNIDNEKIEYIIDGVVPNEMDRLRYGDLLFNTRNTLDLVGKVAVWRDELPLAYYNSNLMRLEFKPDEIASTFFANYAFNSTGCISRLREIATGTTSVAAIYTRDLLKIPFPLPPLPEQHAIATVLSDMDSEIAALEARREKTRALKQGMMQELLTGRIRLV